MQFDGREERDQSCHAEPLCRSRHPLSSASDLFWRFQLTRPHIIAVVLTVVVSIAVVFTVVAITVVCALEWRRVLPSAPLRLVLLPLVRTTRHVITRRAADTTLTHRATRTSRNRRDHPPKFVVI
jgi:hypothetical protein